MKLLWIYHPAWGYKAWSLSWVHAGRDFSLFFVLFFCTAISVCQKLTCFLLFSLSFPFFFSFLWLGQFARIHYQKQGGCLGNWHAAHWFRSTISQCICILKVLCFPCGNFCKSSLAWLNSFKYSNFILLVLYFDSQLGGMEEFFFMVLLFLPLRSSHMWMEYCTVFWPSLLSEKKPEKW